MMPPDRDGSSLDVGFETQALLDVLGDDLKARFPRLDPRAILARALKAFSGPIGGKMGRDGPALRLRGADPVPSACVPSQSRTEGGFADLAFRIARVHDEVRRIGDALDNRSAEPSPCLGSAIRILEARLGNSQEIRDRIQAAIAQALEKADQFDCGREFCPWFARLLVHKVVEVFRTEGKVRIDRSVPLEALPAEEEPREPAPGFRPWWDAVGEGLEAYDIEVSPGWYARVARLQLQRLGIRNPSDQVVAIWARYGHRLREKKERPKGEEPMNVFELLVAYGSHRDFREEVRPSDPAGAVLDEVQKGMEELIAFQKAKNRGKASWDASPDGPQGPADRLSRMQESGWGLLAGREETDPAWKAARNLLWFSWCLKAAATLAVALRHAGPRPELGPLTTALRPLDGLGSFTEATRAAVTPHRAAVKALPPGPPPDSEGRALLLKAAVERACLLKRSGAIDPEAIDAELPDADWRWWISRVTGQGRDHAEAAVRRMADRAGLVPAVSFDLA